MFFLIACVGHDVHHFEGGFGIRSILFGDDFVGRKERAYGQEYLVVVVFAFGAQHSVRHVINFFIFSISFPKRYHNKLDKSSLRNYIYGPLQSLRPKTLYSFTKHHVFFNIEVKCYP